MPLQPGRSTVVLVLLLAGTYDAAVTSHRVARSDQGENSVENRPDFTSGGWNYKRPEDWALDYPQCGGMRQSPINIDFQQVESSAVLDRQMLTSTGHEDSPLKMSLVNNGHSVQLSGEWTADKAPSIYGVPLVGTYEFAQLHFHWGPSIEVGSEHTIDNKSYPLEMHMVYWKKDYKSMTEALKHDDGITVVGYLFSLEMNANMGIERIKAAFPDILEPGQTVDIEPFPLSLFNLDLRKEGYTSYVGSLTTPPCNEAVIWLLSVGVKEVTIDEMEFFQKLQLNHDDDHNYRPTQPLNSRSIRHHFVNGP